jgi:hypothetical protein
MTWLIGEPADRMTVAIDHGYSTDRIILQHVADMLDALMWLCGDDRPGHQLLYFDAHPNSSMVVIDYLLIVSLISFT